MTQATLRLTLSSSSRYWENGQKYSDGRNVTLSNVPGEDRFSYTYYANLGTMHAALTWQQFVEQVRLVRGHWIAKKGRARIDAGIVNGRTTEECWFLEGNPGLSSINDKNRDAERVVHGCKGTAAVLLRDYLTTGDEGQLSLLHDWLADKGLIAEDTPQATPPHPPVVEVKEQSCHRQWLGTEYTYQVVRSFPSEGRSEVLFTSKAAYTDVERQAARLEAEQWKGD